MRLILIMLFLWLTTGCNKVLDVPPPGNELGVHAVFNDTLSAISATVGIYNEMRAHNFFENSGLSFFAARSADDAILKPGTDPFARDSLLYTNSDLESMWSQAFGSLQTINTCIRGLEQSVRLPALLRNQLLGEARFCRAFVNFYLVNFWGDAVPLITSPDVNVNLSAKSVKQQQVYDLIISDLLEAQKSVPLHYEDPNRIRPNLMAVHALLARVYLYQRRYSEALSLSGILIGSTLYQPLPSPDSVFLLNSQEIIWQLAPITGSGPKPVGDFQLYFSGGSLTPELVHAFEPGDLRRASWVVETYVYTPQPNFVTTAYKYKFKVDPNDLQADSPEGYVILRLAEQYLIRAEAHTNLGNTVAAIADLNVLRTRAGLPLLPALLNQQQCMEAVEQERRVELFSEWGHRWFDLKRWPAHNNPYFSRADEVLNVIKPDWQRTDQWYPVPQRELQLNPFLLQNDGYPSK